MGLLTLAANPGVLKNGEVILVGIGARPFLPARIQISSFPPDE